jgi:tetratricopeptide (TPR) repeat protein
LLDGSLFPSIRTRLLATASKMVTLKGAILYDIGRYDQAREHHRIAIQAAAQAAQPTLQAIAYAWMSFSWTYEHQYLEASNAIMQALSLFSDLHEDHETFAWLTAVAAEISANLGNYDASCSFLEQAKVSLERPSDKRYTYLHQFSDAQFRGFQGICYQVLYHPKKPETHILLEQARHSLEQALLDSSTSMWQKQLHLVDLASVYARQGEVEMACTLTKQTVDPTHLATRKNVLQRLTEIQQLLQPWKETIYVKELHGFFRMVGII